ncbi:EAL domain-containing protein [Cupriavidus consociatus]|uniref:EAL domain-containing protein n=1 Tax=Cupriavidus consociatus TaxID=2821357 RepID=UPI001FD72CE8|nr:MULTISPECIES: EAL domain-containing protein [unclassified Cupriavidus]MDK2659984.1 EAL domain-containing protein [Cupriavidus sp. LEh21]
MPGHDAALPPFHLIPGIPAGPAVPRAQIPPLYSVFQPIVQAGNAELLGYEAQVRGPAGSPYALPEALFRLAQGVENTIALEIEAARTALAAWRGLELPGKLFLNFSPMTLRYLLADRERLSAALLRAGIAPSRLVVEVTEQTPIGDAASFGTAMSLLRELGMQYDRCAGLLHRPAVGTPGYAGGPAGAAHAGVPAYRRVSTGGALGLVRHDRREAVAPRTHGIAGRQQRRGAAHVPGPARAACRGGGP